MFRVVIPAILAVALTACGGGGSGGNVAPSVDLIQHTATVYARELNLAVGKFKGGDTQHLVMAGMQHLGAGRTGPSPVKVYQLNDNTQNPSKRPDHL